MHCHLTGVLLIKHITLRDVLLESNRFEHIEFYQAWYLSTSVHFEANLLDAHKPCSAEFVGTTEPSCSLWELCREPHLGA